MLSNECITNLIETAITAREKAYAPYSGYLVGAALLTKNGKIFYGCNVENASYGATNCAERTAFFKAVSEGENEFIAIAIVGGVGIKNTDYAFPCGVCRQVMQEFCEPDFQVIAAKDKNEYRMFSLEELLPYGFSK